ncbi:MAG: NADPH-dependent FMN reductase [Pseudomonadota bacterium]
MAEYSLLCISGALRKGSTNRKLIAEAVRLFGPADVTHADLNLPLYDGDVEEASGVPEAVQTLSDQIQAADAVIIASPEYNKSIPGVLKNALDWISRTKGGPWAGKPVALMSAAAGRTGGETGLYSIRAAMAAFRPRIVPGAPVMVAASYEAFGEDGQLKAESYVDAVTGLMDALKNEIALVRAGT